jgi:hypothetical protein
MNLLTSFAEDVAPVATIITKPIEGIETLEEDESGNDWLGEYQRGCDWEIYTTELARTFEGTTFSALADILYHKLGIVLFGLEVSEIRPSSTNGSSSSSSTGTSRKKQIFLNPADFIIPSQDDYQILAFVIAKNKASSDLTFSKVNGIFNSGMAFSQLSLLASSTMTNRMPGDFRYNKDGELVSSDHEKEKAKKKSPTSSSPSPHKRGSPSTSPSTALKKSLSPGQSRGKSASFSSSPSSQMKWQQLLRKYEHEKTTESLQEELSKAEDRHLAENYFIRSYRVELSDVYIQTSIHDELPFMENHIIIIGKSLSNLYDLIRPLRAKSLGILKHIVILYPIEFPLHVWQRISIFEGLWILRGNAVEEADLRRCGIFKAKQVILLASPTKEISMNHIPNIENAASSIGKRLALPFLCFLMMFTFFFLDFLSSLPPFLPFRPSCLSHRYECFR